MTDSNQHTIEVKRIDEPLKFENHVFDGLDKVIRDKIQRYVNLGVQKDDIAPMLATWNLNGSLDLARKYLAQAAPGKNDEDVETDQDAGLPKVPDDAWVGLFARYRDLVAGTTEASDNYHFADFLVTFGCTLAHHVYVHYAGPLFPNFYVCNVGRTGESRKTTAANRAVSLTNKLNAQEDEDEEYHAFMVLNQLGSIEALYDSLSGKRRVRLIYYSELGSLMAKAQQSGTANIITDLTNLWDVPMRLNPSTRHIRVNCELPFVSILACSTLEWLYKYISLESIYSGFANRWNFIYGEPKPPMPNPPPVDPKGEQDLLREINEVRKWAMEVPGGRLINKSPEAEEMWNEFYISFFNEQLNKTGLLPELMIRVPVFIWKIATLYAVQDKYASIRGKDLHRAIRVGRFLENSMRTVFRGYSNTEGRKKEDKLLEYLKKKGAVDLRTLYRSLNMSADELGKISNPLVKMGVINRCMVGKKEGLQIV